MSKYTSWWYKYISNATIWFSSVKWTDLLGKLRGTNRGFNLTDEDLDRIKEILAGGFYIILNQRKTHLTTYGIGLLSYIKTKKWPIYGHVLMNLDLVNDPDQFEKFKLMEATSSGVHYSTFMEVFDCDGVCIMRPTNLVKEEWDEVMQGLAMQLGKPYDNLFDINDVSRVSCVEMVLDALRHNPNYLSDFPNLEKMIKTVGNLTPQMYRDCADFEVIFEVLR